MSRNWKREIRKLPRCKHLHLSGRRCGQGTSDSSGMCGTHRGDCTECRTMAERHIPPKGW